MVKSHKEWGGQERRDNAGLTEEQIEALTDAVSGRLEGRLYVAIGKAAFRAFLLLAGSVGAGVLAARFLGWHS